MSSSLATKRGIANIAPSVEARLVLAEIVDALIKGKLDAFTIADLASKCVLSTKEVKCALSDLSTCGIIECPRPWDEVGSFTIETVRVMVEPDQLSLPQEPRSVEQSPEAMDRVALGYQEVQVGDDWYRIKVDPLSESGEPDSLVADWYVLNVTKAPGGEMEPPEPVITEKECESQALAWLLADRAIRAARLDLCIATFTDCEPGMLSIGEDAFDFTVTAEDPYQLRVLRNGEPIIEHSISEFAEAVEYLRNFLGEQLAQYEAEQERLISAPAAEVAVAETVEGSAEPDALEEFVHAAEESPAAEPKKSAKDKAAVTPRIFTFVVDNGDPFEEAVEPIDEYARMDITYERGFVLKGGALDRISISVRNAEPPITWIKELASSKCGDSDAEIEEFAADVARSTWRSHVAGQSQGEAA